jgi:hypothetical protein
MALRSDELRAMEVFVQFVVSVYGEKSVSWEPEENDPPDANMTINNIKYAVEVTTIPELHTIGLSEPQNSKAVDSRRRRIVGRVEKRAHKRGILTGRYYMSFYLPKPNDDSDENGIVEQALDYIQQTQNERTAERYVISGNRFKHASIQKTGDDETFVRLAGGSGPIGFPDDIQPSCDALEKVLDDKAFMTGFPEAAILLVLHDPMTRLTNTYQLCDHLQAKIKKFHTVFIVSNEAAGPHEILYSENPDWMR